MEKQRILLVSHEMSYTGAPRSLLNMCRLLKNQEFDISVWTLRTGEFEREFHKTEVKVQYIHFPEDTSENVVKQLQKFDLVIANTVFCAAFAAYASAYVPVILYLREAANMPELIKNCALNERDLYRVKNIVCVSEYAADFFRTCYGLEQVKVIHNFIEDEGKEYAFLGECCKKRDDRKVRFLLSGTIEPRKGQQIAMDAYHMLPTEYREKAELHFIGAMPEWAEEYQKALDWEKVEGVYYHGMIEDRKQLMHLYMEADAVLIPSLDESCSLVALEAAMLGKVVLMSQNVGASYLVSEEAVTETGNVHALCMKMKKVICDKDWCKQQGGENQKRYIQTSTPEVYKRDFFPYMEQCIEKKKKSMDGMEQRRAMLSKDYLERVSVSVIVPVYNVADYLRECMESLMIQTLPDMEFICVDDGSTDESSVILAEYAKRDRRVRIIRTENYGYGHAMNIGMQEARGGYIGIVEPDDYVENNMFEILYHRAIATDSDIVKADFYRFYGTGEDKEAVYQWTARSTENYNRLINPQEEKGCFRFIMNTWSGIYRRTFLEEYGIFHNETPGASFQDNGFWFRGFCYTKRMYFVNRPLYHNRRDNPGSSVNSREKIYCVNEEYRNIREFLRKHPDLEKEYIYQYSMKKYHTYLFNLERIAWEYKKEYLRVFAEEFKNGLERGELSKAVFTPQEWSNLHWIMRDYKEYYEKAVKGEIKISVIIPVYNNEKQLKRCLNSIRAQYFQKYEVLCINDGSTDNSEAVIQSYVRRDKRFRLINQLNQGAGAARNRGLAEAKGKYVIFLDADDFFAQGLLGNAYRKIREDDAEICVVESSQYDENTEVISPCQYSICHDKLPQYSPFRLEEVMGNPFRCFMGWAWDKLYLRRFLVDNELQFQKQRTTNDMYFTYMSLFKAEKITTLNERLIYQRRNRKGSLSLTREQSWECFCFALEAMQEELRQMGLFEANRVYFANYALHSCLWNLETLSLEVAEQLLEQLETKWFKRFTIDELQEQEFEYREEYEKYLVLRKQGIDGVKAIQELYHRNNMPENKAQEEPTKESLKEISKQFVSNQRARESFMSDAEYYGYCLDEIRKSKSYKIGQMITWLPRKIRGW